MFTATERCCQRDATALAKKRLIITDKVVVKRLGNQCTGICRILKGSRVATRLIECLAPFVHESVLRKRDCCSKMRVDASREGQAIAWKHVCCRVCVPDGQFGVGNCCRHRGTEA